MTGTGGAVLSIESADLPALGPRMAFGPRRVEGRPPFRGRHRPDVYLENPFQRPPRRSAALLQIATHALSLLPHISRKSFINRHLSHIYLSGHAFPARFIRRILQQSRKIRIVPRMLQLPRLQSVSRLSQSWHGFRILLMYLLNSGRSQVRNSPACRAHRGAGRYKK